MALPVARPARRGLRRLNEQAEIIMVEKSGYVSYANCGLPYYVGGAIAEKKNLTLQTPESFRNRFRVDARVRPGGHRHRPGGQDRDHPQAGRRGNLRGEL